MVVNSDFYVNGFAYGSFKEWI